MGGHQGEPFGTRSEFWDEFGIEINTPERELCFAVLLRAYHDIDSPDSHLRRTAVSFFRNKTIRLDYISFHFVANALAKDPDAFKQTIRKAIEERIQISRRIRMLGKHKAVTEAA